MGFSTALEAFAQTKDLDLGFARKGLKIVVGAGAGGGNDLYARLLARHLGTRLPDKAPVTVINMPGASSIAAANYISKVAPRDGTVILSIVQSLPYVQAFGQANIDFDLAQFQWIGNMTDSPVTFITWHTSLVSDVEAAKRVETIFGSTTPGSLFSMMPMVMNRLLGTRFKVVNGYPSGSAIELALEAGEIAGFGGSTWASLTVNKPSWLRENNINVLAQAGLRRAPGLPAPLLTDLAQTETQRSLLTFFSGVVAFARAFAVGPDVPADRVSLLRDAFDAVVADDRFLEDARNLHIDINPTSGEVLQKIIIDLVHADASLLAQAKELVSE